MGLTSIGDQSQMFLSQKLAAHLRRDLERLTQEMGTERRQTLASPASGDLIQLLSLRRDITGLSAYKTAAAEAQLAAKTVQTVLERISTAASQSSVAMVAAGLSRSGAEIASAAADAEVRFTTLVHGLNAQAAGQSLFAGTATDRPAMAEPAPILAALQTATNGAANAADLQASLEAWFLSPGGGYESMALQGNQQVLSYRISAGEDVSLGVTAGDPALRRALLGLAMAALAPKLADIGQQATLMSAAGTSLIEAGADIIALRGDLGATEARIAQRAAQLDGEATALGLAEAELIGVDPFDTATALEATAKRLDALYMVTARLSRLTLSEYLR